MRIAGSFLIGWSAVWAMAGTAEGTVWNVSTVSALNYAVGHAASGDEIVIAAGSYNLTGDLLVQTPNLLIRGQTGNRDDVVLVGGGMNSANGPREGIQIYRADVTVRDLTVAECYYHAIHFQNGAHRARVSNVKTLNIGEHHLKGVRYTDGVVIEFCRFEQTKTRINDGVARPDNYLGGPDLIGASNCQVRDNVALNIKAADFGYGDPGIFLWQEILNPVIERNVVVGCNKGIGLGNPYNPDNIYHGEDGIIRNNFIVRGDDIGLELCYTKNVKVYNNTVYSQDANYFRTLHILDSAAVPTVNLQLAYNIIRGRILNNTVAGGWTSTGDIVGSTAAPTWFVDPAAGDLHLTLLALPAIDGAVTLAEVPADIDGQVRPAGTDPDVGADEYVSLATLLPGQCEPLADRTLPKQRYNVIRLVFDRTIQLPAGVPLEITPIGGGTDVGGQFTYSLETTNVAQDTLKAVENLAVLSNRTWYRVEPAAGLLVQDFAHDVCTLQGDADGSGQVLAQDYFPVKNHLFELTEARYELDGDGMVLAQDYFVAKNHLFDAKPAKP